ncbi:MAG: CBS domain-containing protein, partial [Planctomycetota bacterium]
VMSTGVTSATTETTVGEAIRVMDAGGYRHLPVVEHAGKPAGAVSVHDIVHYLVGHFPDTVYNLPPKANPAAGEREGA